MLSTYSEPGRFAGAGDATVNKTDPIPAPSENTAWCRRYIYKQAAIIQGDVCYEGERTVAMGWRIHRYVIHPQVPMRGSIRVCERGCEDDVEEATPKLICSQGAQKSGVGWSGPRVCVPFQHLTKSLWPNQAQAELLPSSHRIALACTNTALPAPAGEIR